MFLYTPSWSWGQAYSSLKSAKLSYLSGVTLLHILERQTETKKVLYQEVFRKRRSSKKILLVDSAPLKGGSDTICFK